MLKWGQFLIIKKTGKSGLQSKNLLVFNYQIMPEEIFKPYKYIHGLILVNSLFYEKFKYVNDFT